MYDINCTTYEAIFMDVGVIRDIDIRYWYIAHRELLRIGLFADGRYEPKADMDAFAMFCMGWEL